MRGSMRTPFGVAHGGVDQRGPGGQAGHVARGVFEEQVPRARARGLALRGLVRDADGDGPVRVQERVGGEVDDGEPVASLYVYKGAPESGKLLAEIKLDTHTVVNNISHALADDGIAESDSL